MINILMGGLELSLEVLVHLESFSHFFVSQELIRNIKWNQKFSCVGSSEKLGHFRDEPVQKMLDGLFLAMNDISLERWVEVAWIPEHFEEATDSLLCFVLSFMLDIYGEMRFVKIS